jgi:hypothetical protein
VSVVTDRSRPAGTSPWQPASAAPSDSVLDFTDHARALVNHVLPTPGDDRRILLARDLGSFLQRWNPAGEFDRRLREIYPPGPFDDRG